MCWRLGVEPRPESVGGAPAAHATGACVLKISKAERAQRTALEELCQKLKPRLHVIAGVIYRDQPTLTRGDLVQIGYMEIITLVRRDGLLAHTRSYLLKRAEGQMLTAMHREFRRLAQMPVSVEEIVAAGYDLPDASVRQVEATLEARGIVARAALTPRERLVLRLIYQRGMRLREAAAELNGVSRQSIHCSHVGALLKCRVVIATLRQE